MNNIQERIKELMQRHILVKDGAIGTTLTGTRRDIVPDTLSISDYDRVVAMYEASIKAGANIITSNTFMADPLMLASCGVETSTDDIVAAALRAAREAREKSGKEVFIAGSIGPSTRNITLAIDLTEDELRASYRTLIEALKREGADILLIESVTDVRNAEIAAELCREIAPELPIILEIYHFLVNKQPGITERYHKFHDGSSGIKKYISWLYLLWLNICYYIFFCRFLGRKSEIAIYEEKKLPLTDSESILFHKENNIVQDGFVELLSKYHTVSFDIFDTLIFRPFSEPTDLFYFVGDALGVMDFKRIRMEVEQKARQKRFEKYKDYEVTLSEIWELMEKETGISASKGMEIEMQMELKYCYANPFMQSVFNKMQEMGKQVIIISDMYLPKSFLHQMLEKNGYKGITHLYSSCEYRKSKAKGDLFSFVIKDCEIAGLSIHVGDNVHSDVKMAKKAGVAVAYYPNVNKNSILYRPYDMSCMIGGAYRGIVNTAFPHVSSAMRRALSTLTPFAKSVLSVNASDA